MIKKLSGLIFALLLGFSSTFTTAQNSTLSRNPDPRLYEAFGKGRIDFLQQNNPDLIEYYNFYLDNACVLEQHPSEKIPGIISSCPIMELISPEMTMDKPDMAKGTKSINILKYQYKIEQDKTTQYRLDDSGIVIVFYPAKITTEKYNKAKNL